MNVDVPEEICEERVESGEFEKTSEFDSMVLLDDSLSNELSDLPCHHPAHAEEQDDMCDELIGNAV
jgi:hypothetical protein